MSGHSKWATTKHRKGAKDSARAKVFAKLIRQVEVAAREGGGDVDTNASLRTMYQKAREASVPLDNRNRTSAEIKHVFARNGGTIAEPGAVSWQFDRKGVIEVQGPLDEDQLLEWVMEAGGENFEENGENFTVTTEPQELGSVRDALDRLGAKVLSAELTLVPQNSIPVDSETEAKKILRLMDAIDDHDDVQNVFSNFDISDEILTAYES
jgi:transcriptional/translational regulatory protein YebC/TACO1